MINIVKKVGNNMSLKKLLEQQDIVIKYSEKFKIISESKLFFNVEVEIDNKKYLSFFPKIKKKALFKQGNVIVIPFYKGSAIEDLADIVEFKQLKTELLFRKRELCYKAEKRNNIITIYQLDGYLIDVLKHILTQLYKRGFLNIETSNNIFCLLKKELVYFKLDFNFPLDISFKRLEIVLKDYTGCSGNKVKNKINKLMNRYIEMWESGNINLKRQK